MSCSVEEEGPLLDSLSSSVGVSGWVFWWVELQAMLGPWLMGSSLTAICGSSPGGIKVLVVGGLDAGGLRSVVGA